MEKAKLTQEQANAIERGIKIYGKSRIMNDHAPDGWAGNLNDLNGLTKDEIARALYVGYEVEPEFKSGDWIINNNEIIKLSKMQAKLANGLKDKSHLRHATDEEIAEEKQRRWWQMHDREVWQIIKGDALIEVDADNPVIVLGRHRDNILFTDDSMYDFEYVKKYYQVFCFAEDRKDV